MSVNHPEILSQGKKCEAMTYKAILFDLFRTLILFDDKAPTMKAMEPSWRSAMEALREPATKRIAGLPFDGFLDALAAETVEIARARTADHFEIPAHQRYLRALKRIGIERPDLEDSARELAAMQMDQLAAHTRFPRKHARLLRHLRTTHRLALVSNFDDGPVIHRILAREGIANLFDVTLISAEFGRRKPHPEIFHTALKHLELEPRAALFVGDSLIDDVGGACAAGIDVVWLEGAGLDAHTATADGPKPTYVIQSLDDLRAIA